MSTHLVIAVVRAEPVGFVSQAPRTHWTLPWMAMKRPTRLIATSEADVQVLQKVLEDLMDKRGSRQLEKILEDIANCKHVSRYMQPNYFVANILFCDTLVITP